MPGLFNRIDDITNTEIRVSYSLYSILMIPLFMVTRIDNKKSQPYDWDLVRMTRLELARYCYH